MGAIGLSFACATEAPPTGADEAPAFDVVALVGATLYPAPDAPAVADGVVVIRSGIIGAVGPRDQVAVPAGATRIDCTGGFLVAGFQNSHVHFTEAKWRDPAGQPAETLSLHLGEMLLRHGFTAVVDTASLLEQTLALRRRIEAGEVPGPRIFTAGLALYPEDGIPFYLKESLSPEELAGLHMPRTGGEAEAIVAEQIAAGADLVKLFVGSWVARGQVELMALDVARAAVEAAHARGKPVAAHASSVPGLEVALEAGVDILAHALDDDRGWSLEHAERMVQQSMAMVPTLKLFGGQPYTRFIQQEVRDLAEAGGQILFGTDVGFLADDDPTEEYELMAGAGLDWRAILASLTTEPAARFGGSARRGRLDVGMDADLVLLGSDPAKDTTAFADVRRAYRSGKLVFDRDDAAPDGGGGAQSRAP